MWKACNKAAQKGKNFCPEHVNEIEEASSRIHRLVMQGIAALGTGIVVNMLYEILKGLDWLPRVAYHSEPSEEQYRRDMVHFALDDLTAERETELVALFKNKLVDRTA